MTPKHSRPWRPIWLLTLFWLVGLACTLPSLGGPTGPLPTPTPLGDTLSFLVPIYSVQLNPGDTVPGTRLQYIGPNDSAHDVLIDGLPATKRTGDSFAWFGVLAPAVSARYNLRLATSLFGSLTAAGPVELVVYNPAPVELPTTTRVNTPLHFQNVTVQYRVIEGGQIPGSTLRYVGYADPGSGTGQPVAQRMAQLAGTSGYPFVALGDSLTWYGRLQNHFYLRYNLRVTSIDDNGLQLIGTGEIWITRR